MVQLFKQCHNLSSCTVLQWCSCLSCVETYLPTLCCRGAAVKVVSQPICQHCVAGVQQLKRCRNLSASTVLQRCSCLSHVATYLPGTVLQGCSCLNSVTTYLPALCYRVCSSLSVVETYLLALCCRGAAVSVVSKPICRDCVAEKHLFKWCRNLSASTVLQRCNCLSGVQFYLQALCCRGAAV